MINNIDPSSQNIAASAALKKVSQKNNDGKEKFTTKTKKSEKSETSVTEEIKNVAPMLFLQEIDEYAQELENLDVFASVAFKQLKQLQLDLLRGNISENNLANLRGSLNHAQDKFFTKELKELANQIMIRVEVEIAKIEMA